MTEDNVMRGLLDSKKRRKGWKTSADAYTPEKSRTAVDGFVAWMKAQSTRNSPR